MDLLWAEMSVLKHLRDDVERRGEPKMEKWIHDVDAQAREVNNLRKEISEIRKGGYPSKSRLEVHEKVIDILGVVAELKRIGSCNVLEHRIVSGDDILGGNDIRNNGDGRSTENVERFLSNMASDKPLRFSSMDVKSFTSNFVVNIGCGGYGEVYKGQFPNGVEIAVKVLNENVSDDVKKQFMAEVGTMGRTYHRNLVRLYGYCFDTNLKALVYEFMEKGSLDKILYENRFKLEWEKLYHIATEAAKGLSYLHESCHKRIIHCDIKAGNVLIDSNLCPKIADFGLAKLCDRDLSHFTLRNFRGTPGYAAPEMWMPTPVTYKCDVYSFGMMLFEILGRRKNYNRDLGEARKWFPRQVWEKFENGKLEEIMMDCGIEAKNRGKAKTLAMVALWCAQHVPENRPSMSTVVKILEGEIKAANPPNPFPRMITSGTASMVMIESSEAVSALVSSEVDITSNGNSIRSKAPISFSSVSSEASSVIPRGQVALEPPLPEPTVETEEKNKKTKVVITSNRNSIRSKVPISFSSVSSEEPPVIPEGQVVLKSPLPEPTVEIREKNKKAAVVITSNGNSIRSKVPISFSSVSSEESPVVPEGQVVLKFPLPEPTVGTEEKNKNAEVVTPEEKKEAEVVRPEEKKDEVITVVLMVYMHCESCGQVVTKHLRKMKGVQTVSTDLGTSQVTVRGIIDPQKVVEYVYKKTKKRATIVKVESEKADVAKATAEAMKLLVEVAKAIATERKKKQERAIAEIILEKKPINEVVTIMEEAETEEEKEIVHTESKKNQEVGGAEMNSMKRREERKEGAGVVKKEEGIKEENTGFVQPKHEKMTKVKKEEEEGAANTIPEVEEVETLTSTLIREKEEEKVSVKPNAGKSEREKVEELQDIRNAGAHMKEMQEENSGENNLDKKIMNIDNRDKEKERKLIKEEWNKMDTERKENVYNEDPLQYRYVQSNNENYRYDSNYDTPHLFSDDNPNAWCSIQ